MARKFFPVLLTVAALLIAVLPSVSAQDDGFPVPPGRLTVGDDDGLFLLPADGSDNVDYLVEDEDPECWIRDGAWNADGTQIMYTLICGGAGPTDWRPNAEVEAQRDRTATIYVYDVDSGESTELITPDPAFQDYAGNWSPDGEQAVIYSDRNDTGDPEPRFNLFLVDVESGELTQLTNFDSNASRVSFDPTGRYLLYNRRAVVEQNRLVFEVHAYDLNAQNDISVAEGFTPNWSPDGEWIVYASEGDGADIFVMPVTCLSNGGGCDPEADAINVTQTPDIVEREPMFSPDQTQLVYLRDTSAPLDPIFWDLYRQDLRSGLLQNITESADISERHRAWEPVDDADPIPVTDVLPVIGRVQTAQGAANLRDEASTNGAIAGQVLTGQVVFLQGTNAGGDWYKITLPGDGAEAWLFGTLVQVISGDETTLETVE